MHRKLLAAVVLLAATLPVAAARAQVDTPSTVPAEATVDSGNAKKWSVGLGAGFAPDYEGSSDYQAVPLWNVVVRDLYGPTTNIRLFGPQLLSNLIPSPNWRLGPMAQFVRDYDNVKNNDVQHLEDVSSSFLIGLVGGYDFHIDKTQVLGFDAMWRADVAHGNGWLLSFGPRYGAALSKEWQVTGSILATYASEDYMDNYFSVSAADERRTGLNQYGADASFKDVAFSLAVSYDITPNWTVSGIGQFKQMVGDAADSPVVDEAGSKAQGFGGLLISYNF
ncbi:MAG: MipA/OmpV family protein [Geminicoccaceae bacterium]